MKLITLLLFTQLSFASIGGKWIGEGVAKTPKSTQKCSQIYFKLFYDASKFKIQEGGYNCNGLSAEYPYSVFEVRGPLLYYKGEVSGFINNDELTIYSKEDGFTLRFYFVAEDEVEVSETWQEGSDYLTIKSTLFRK
ncbi:hypothetical protein ABMA70_05315 [Halobacteriovorax sp. XZX-3]|uniref:hypothetical protein n=1 Tax=unclassified Halobacteriovorax TaxID=2639665 RepID=UPI00371FEA55